MHRRVETRAYPTRAKGVLASGAATPAAIVVVFLFVMMLPYLVPLDMVVASPNKGGRTIRAVSAWIDHSGMMI